LAALDEQEALAACGAEPKAAVPRIVDLLWEFGSEFGVVRSLGRIGPGAAER
jgi:hypothetical protein